MLLHDVEGKFSPNWSEVSHRSVEAPMFGMPLLHLVLEVLLGHHWIVRSTAMMLNVKPGHRRYPQEVELTVSFD